MERDVVLRILAEHREELGKFRVKSISLFGSVVRGSAGPESDVDILVEFDPDAHIGLFEFSRLRDLLSQILGRSVDLATPDALHPALKDRILKEAVRAA